MKEAIARLLEVQAHALIEAARIAEAASNAETINQAVGTMLALENHLKAAQATYDAVIALHRVAQ